jgi:hypothetical protein
MGPYHGPAARARDLAGKKAFVKPAAVAGKQTGGQTSVSPQRE